MDLWSCRPHCLQFQKTRIDPMCIHFCCNYITVDEWAATCSHYSQQLQCSISQSVSFVCKERKSTHWLWSDKPQKQNVGEPVKPRDKHLQEKIKCVRKKETQKGLLTRGLKNSQMQYGFKKKYINNEWKEKHQTMTDNDPQRNVVKKLNSFYIKVHFSCTNILQRRGTCTSSQHCL